MGRGGTGGLGRGYHLPTSTEYFIILATDTTRPMYAS